MNRNNQVPHLTRDTIWENDKNTTHKRANRSALFQQAITRLQETDKRYKDKHETQILKRFHKSLKKHRLRKIWRA